MQIDILIEDDAWDAAALRAVARAGCGAALERVGLAPDRFAVAILACGDDRIAALNADFRGKAASTNVLSWPAEALSPGDVPRDPELGDIAIAHGICTREATAQGKSFQAHVTHLLVHATLHLLGHDHQTDTEAEMMEAIERDTLAKLGLPDPY